MGKLNSLWVGILSWLALRSGFELVGVGVLPPAGVEMPDSNLVKTDGVELLGLKIWTEGAKDCDHDYRKVRARNSHRYATKDSSGKSEHLDYTCSKCTHRLCDWGMTKCLK